MSGWPWWVYVLLIVGACTCWGVVYKVTDDDCKGRGGHTEIIYGRRASWVCDGADR